MSNQTKQIYRYLSNQSRLDSLRFMTCGSVDDGKSTLIGRLLYEAQLYFAKERPVVEREGSIIMVDDERMRLLPKETIQTKKVRFRTLGCYPLTGAVESEAADLESILLELLESRMSERTGRVIDSDSSSSMEKKKRHGYF